MLLVFRFEIGFRRVSYERKALVMAMRPSCVCQDRAPTYMRKSERRKPGFVERDGILHICKACLVRGYIRVGERASLVGVELAFRRETRTRRLVDKHIIYGRVQQEAGWYLAGNSYTAVVRTGGCGGKFMFPKNLSLPGCRVIIRFVRVRSVVPVLVFFVRL